MTNNKKERNSDSNVNVKLLSERTAILSISGKINAITFRNVYENVRKLITQNVIFQIWDMGNADFESCNECDYIGMIIKLFGEKRVVLKLVNVNNENYKKMLSMGFSQICDIENSIEEAIKRIDEDIKNETNTNVPRIALCPICKGKIKIKKEEN